MIHSLQKRKSGSHGFTGSELAVDDDFAAHASIASAFFELAKTTAAAPFHLYEGEHFQTKSTKKRAALLQDALAMGTERWIEKIEDSVKSLSAELFIIEVHSAAYPGCPGL